MGTCKTTAADMERIRACAGGFVKSAGDIPFSCKIGGRYVKGLPESFSPRSEKRFVDSNIIEYKYTAIDPVTQLRFHAECLEYLDFPVVEWTVWIENGSDTDSPVISELYGMDGTLPGRDPAIVYSNGDTTDRELYTESICVLNKETRFLQHPDGGRASDCAWPYYRVLCDGFGYNLSIGWPGQWLSEFTSGEEGFGFKAKQQYTNFYLKPHEKVRTPRMSIMTFEGGAERGINMWRRWMTAYVIPKPWGRIIEPGFALCDEENSTVLFTQTTEQRELDTLENLNANNIVPEYFWIDAGWYPCKGADGVGDWTNTGILHADRERFPDGMKALSEKCHEYGAKLLVWFEPERIKLSHKSEEYPDDYVITLKDTSVLEHVRLTGIDRSLIDNMGLMDLSNPACCEWLINHIDGIIKEFGIDVYRQDFNFPPLNWWMQHDGSEDRMGITENLYNQGYLHFWDELLLRNPGLFINSVSSGGRRSDLESLRRSVSLHQSDYGFGQHPIHQAMMTSSFMWHTFCGTQVRNHDREDGEYELDSPYLRPYALQNFDNFAAHNGFCPFMFPNREGMRSLGYPRGEFKNTDECRYYSRFREIWKRAVPYTMDSDLYILAMTDRTNRCYHAIQFHNEDRNEGILQVIRNTKCEEDVFTAKLFGIAGDRDYLLESPEFHRCITVSGEELTGKGFAVRIPKRSGEIWFYKAQ